VVANGVSHARAWINAANLPEGTRAVYAASLTDVMGWRPETTRYICLDGWAESKTAHRVFDSIKERGFVVWPPSRG
jgi:hypothetical protein